MAFAGAHAHSMFWAQECALTSAGACAQLLQARTGATRAKGHCSKLAMAEQRQWNAGDRVPAPGAAFRP